MHLRSQGWFMMIRGVAVVRFTEKRIQRDVNLHSHDECS